MRVLALSMLILAACGGTPSNCASVTCGSLLSCDPSDGVCKCGGRGGVRCGDGFVCSAGGTCESIRQVDCSDEPGTSADVFDGLCKCGGTGGALCSTSEICRPNSKTCVAAKSCDLIACARNESCEPSTGRCRCGTTSCTARQACSPEKTCVTNSCSGVTCSSNSQQCDPTDGACKCNGAPCLSGEACACPSEADGGCASSALACRAGTACAGVTCAAPSTCDPVDGQCKCGGSGGAVCGAMQVCSLAAALQCQGGEQCQAADGGPVACASGSSCDPEDGRCKCGGLGGIACSAHEICIRNASSSACRLPCDVRNPSCPTGAYCYFDSSAAVPAAYCSAATDSKAEESACTQPTACFASNPARAVHCAGLVMGQTGICRSYCDAASGNSGCVQVPKAQTCVQLSSAPAGFGICLPR